MSPLSLYQIVHTLDGEIFHLEEHLKILFESYFELFNRSAREPLAEAKERIESLLRRSRCPRGVSLFVRLTLLDDATLLIEEHERSLYQGYTMRCISPRAALIEYNFPRLSLPTLLRESATICANEEARKKSQCEVALRLHNGEVDLINGAQIFALYGNELITARKSLSVEHRFAKECATNLSLQIVERDIRAEELTLFDELFFVDHYGVTPIKMCCGRYYMSLTASAIADELKHGERR
ncbi:MAG: aminotransferase class IV [Rikenellaceae bacterium]